MTPNQGSREAILIKLDALIDECEEANLSTLCSGLLLIRRCTLFPESVKKPLCSAGWVITQIIEALLRDKDCCEHVKKEDDVMRN